MSLAPENAKERRYQYNTDPKFNMVIDALCHMAVDEEEGDKKMEIAHGFFLYGISVVEISNGEVMILDPAMCSEAEEGILVKPPKTTSFLAHPLVLRRKGEHPVPHVESGMLRGLDPWLEEWDRAKTELGGFFQERLGR